MKCECGRELGFVLSPYEMWWTRKRVCKCGRINLEDTLVMGQVKILGTND